MNTPRMRPAGGRLAWSLRTLATGSDLTLPGDLTAEECGCAPTPAESRAFRAGVSRRTLLTAGTLSAAAVLVAGPLLPAAFAATYPSWEDVQAAKANEATKAAEVQRIQGLIQSLTGEVARTRTAAEQAAGAFYTAQQEYFDASIRADTLQSQADLEAQNATDAANKAGRIAAQLYRDGGDTTSLELFLSGSAATADDLLSRLGVMDKLLERNQAVYAAALTARDAAQSLTDQAVVARDERDRLQQVAEQKMLESQQAADAAQAALDAQTLHLGELQAQLAALEDTTAKTIADYQAGVEAARIAEEQRRAAERAEAERLAASGGAGGGVVSSGWARPTSGHRTSGFGPRSSQCGNGYCSTSYHYGVHRRLRRVQRRLRQLHQDRPRRRDRHRIRPHPPRRLLRRIRPTRERRRPDRQRRQHRQRVRLQPALRGLRERLPGQPHPLPRRPRRVHLIRNEPGHHD